MSPVRRWPRNRPDFQLLLGSTSEMGVGTNAQDRVIAPHRAACPESEVVRYVTCSWQTVERRAKFIGQFMSGQLTAREIDDLGEMSLSATEVKALSRGISQDCALGGAT